MHATGRGHRLVEPQPGVCGTHRLPAADEEHPRDVQSAGAHRQAVRPRPESSCPAVGVPDPPLTCCRGIHEPVHPPVREREATLPASAVHLAPLDVQDALAGPGSDRHPACSVDGQPIRRGRGVRQPPAPVRTGPEGVGVAAGPPAPGSSRSDASLTVPVAPSTATAVTAGPPVGVECEVEIPVLPWTQLRDADLFDAQPWSRSGSRNPELHDPGVDARHSPGTRGQRRHRTVRRECHRGEDHLLAIVGEACRRHQAQPRGVQPHGPVRSRSRARRPRGSSASGGSHPRRRPGRGRGVHRYAVGVDRAP